LVGVEKDPVVGHDGEAVDIQVSHKTILGRGEAIQCKILRGVGIGLWYTKIEAVQV
jgi:hypothetical protein